MAPIACGIPIAEAVPLLPVNTIHGEMLQIDARVDALSPRRIGVNNTMLLFSQFQRDG